MSVCCQYTNIAFGIFRLTNFLLFSLNILSVFVLMNSLNAVTNDGKALIANSTLQIDATPSLYPIWIPYIELSHTMAYVYFPYVYISQKKSPNLPFKAVTNDSKALIANSTPQIDATPSQVLANAFCPIWIPPYIQLPHNMAYFYLPYVYISYRYISCVTFIHISYGHQKI